MDKNLGLIVKTVMTRCIHCTRCVRFAREIAGVHDLGMFGRGLNSEIGTYVQKTFQSELSGNVIELCPVGALTSKLYPFVSRSWELKNVNSIDFSDGFGSNLNIYLKNNKITKISPSFDSTLNSVVWISDKTRFSFDGMFSPERVLEGFIINGDNKYTKSVLWNNLLEEIVNTLYFQDHLNRHFLNINNLIIVFGFVNLEVLNLLILFSKKYSFIKLRKITGELKSVDLEHNFVLNLDDNLSESNICFLIGVNTRYEGSILNIKLRQRYLKGNFKIVSIGSFLDLTIPISYSGLNIEIVKNISEGNHFLCQDIVNSKNPIFILNSEVYKRKDSTGLFSMFKFLTSKFRGDLFNEFNVLNSSLNETGVNYLKKFKILSNNDLSKSSGLYFINAKTNSSDTLNKLINIKVLNYFISNNTRPFFCFDQNNSVSSNLPKKFLLSQSCYNYINLPNNVFFESNGTFINTEGCFKKVVKFLPSVKQSKEDWQILRKIFSYSKKINYLSNPKFNKVLNFNNNSFNNYKNFIGFLYFSNSFLNNNFMFPKKLSGKLKINLNQINISKTRVILTNLKLWIKDFYIGGSDCYSNKSITMINCSNLYRSTNKNFNLVTLIYFLNQNFTKRGI